MSSNSLFHAKGKHIELDFDFIRQRVQAKKLQVQFVSSRDQIADIFTKPLGLKSFNHFRFKVTVIPSPFHLRGRDKACDSQSVK